MSNYGLIITASNMITDSMSDDRKQELANEHKRRDKQAKNIYGMFERNCINASVMKELTRKELEEAVETIKSHTTENNISYFYFNCHGGENGLSIIMGDLNPNNTVNLPFSDLRAILDNIPGKKVVMIEACHSGASISDSVNKEELNKKLRDTRNNVLSAFKAKRTNIKGISLRSGELRSDDYYVITSCHPKEYSFGSVFSEQWCKASGWDCANSKAVARVDNKSYISLKDICDYTAKQHLYYDNPFTHEHFESDQDDMCYPENSDFRVFGDTALNANSEIDMVEAASSKTTYHLKFKCNHVKGNSEYANYQVKLHGISRATSFIPINTTYSELCEGVVRDLTVENIGIPKKLTFRGDIYERNPKISFKTIMVKRGRIIYRGNLIVDKSNKNIRKNNNQITIELKPVISASNAVVGLKK